MGEPGAGTHEHRWCTLNQKNNPGFTKQERRCIISGATRHSLTMKARKWINLNFAAAVVETVIFSLLPFYMNWLQLITRININKAQFPSEETWPSIFWQLGQRLLLRFITLKHLNWNNKIAFTNIWGKALCVFVCVWVGVWTITTDNSTGLLSCFLFYWHQISLWLISVFNLCKLRL